MSEKRCGTCRWWRLTDEGLSVVSFGDCEIPLPERLPMWLRNVGGKMLFATEGTHCKAWDECEKCGNQSDPETEYWCAWCGEWCDHQISMGTMAKLSGVSKGNCSKIERGGNITALGLYKLCWSIGIHPRDVLPEYRPNEKGQA